MRWIVLLSSILLVSCSGSWQLQENNDFFKPTGNRDEKYTQGVRLTRTDNDETGSHSYYVGQSIYTPSDKQATDYLPNDRPYAGFLYAGYTARYVRSPNEQDVYGVSAGVVGPSALGEQAQNEVHRLLGQRTAKGWGNQLKDEPGLILNYEKHYYEPLTQWADTVHIIGGHAGNIFTQVYTSYKVRAGYNLPSAFESGSPIFPRAPRSAWSVYGFGELSERAVARNIFLDGNTWRDSASVQKRSLVGEARVGFSIEKDGYAFTYTLMMLTEEYEGEGSRAGFGEVLVRW